MRKDKNSIIKCDKSHYSKYLFSNFTCNMDGKEKNLIRINTNNDKNKKNNNNGNDNY